MRFAMQKHGRQISVMAIKMLSTLVLGVLFLGLISPSSAATNILLSGQSLIPGKSLREGTYALTLRNDCDIVFTDNGTSLTSTGPAGKGTNCVATMQFDGNFVLYDGSRRTVWSTNTTRALGFYILVLQPDGKIMIYGPAYWPSGIKVP